MSFQAEDYFRNRRITCWTEGKNVRHGWVNIRCIFCDDHSNHLGVNPDGGFSCWRCRSHGSIVKLVKYLEGCSWDQAKNIAKEYGKDVGNAEAGPPSSSDDQCLTKEGHVLPSTFIPRLPRHHYEYLVKRKYDPKTLMQKYKLGFIPGRWRNRIIIPMFMNERLVAFTGRDITGINYPKYKLGNYSVPRDKIIYNIDNIPNRKAVVVEGYSDVWRIGDGAIATMGTHFSDEQLLLISQKCDAVFTLFDQNAADVGEDMANQLSGVVSKVYHYTIERVAGDSNKEVDPDTLPSDLITEIRNKIWT